MLAGTGRLVRALALLFLIVFTCAHGLDPETACALRCQALSGGGCCSMPADHTHGAPCCVAMSHAPSAALLFEAAPPALANPPPALIGIAEPPAAAAALVHLSLRLDAALAFELPAPVCLRL